MLFIKILVYFAMCCAILIISFLIANYILYFNQFSLFSKIYKMAMFILIFIAIYTFSYK